MILTTLTDTEEAEKRGDPIARRIPPRLRSIMAAREVAVRPCDIWNLKDGDWFVFIPKHQVDEARGFLLENGYQARVKLISAMKPRISPAYVSAESVGQIFVLRRRWLKAAVHLRLAFN